MNIQQKLRLIICVMVCIGGLLIMGYIFGVAPLQTLYAQIENSLGPRLILFIVAAVMVVFGLAGIRLPMRVPPSERRIVFHSEYGDIEIQLNSVERNIKRVLKKLPEIHKVKVRVYADESMERAVVEADCVLAQHPDSPDHARQVANRISGYIALMARKTMGLEELATIKVNVVNVHYTGSSSIFGVLDPPVNAFSPVLLEHNNEQLELVEEQSPQLEDAAPEPEMPATPSLVAEKIPEAIPEEEHEQVSAGPELGSDLGSDFDDFDFSSIHDASLEDDHEISQAGFEVPDAHDEGQGTDDHLEPDFKIVDMRVQERADEAAVIATAAEAESEGVQVAVAESADAEETVTEQADLTASAEAEEEISAADAPQQVEAAPKKNEPKSKKPKSRKGKKR